MQYVPGQTFARYTIEREIGQGGMGRVYLATDSVLKRHVALKMLLPERTAGEGPARFAREASLAAMVTHPNIVGVYDYGTADGQAYIAMEYIEGDTLTTYLGEATLPLTKRLLWLLDVGRALAAAHEKGLVHRDVKPSNVMVTRSGVVKVLDFGLAKQTTPTSGPRAFQTLEGRVLGTPRYMAPEQIQGKPVTPQTDQYGLGVLAYELITGAHPNGANGRVDPPKLLTEVDPSLLFLLAVMVARTLAKNPEDRFPSMHELNAELERVITDVAPGSLDRATSPFGTGAGEIGPGEGGGPRGTLPIGPGVLILGEPSSTLPVGGVGGVRLDKAAQRGAVAPALAPAPAVGMEGQRALTPKTLVSPAAPLDPTPAPLLAGPPPAPNAVDPGTLRSAFDDLGRPLGLAIDAVVRQAERDAADGPAPPEAPEAPEALEAGLRPRANERRPPSVHIVPAPPRLASSGGWSKGMWLTVIGVGICGIVAGALLTAWALGTSEPSSGPSPSSPAPPAVSSPR